MTQLNLLPVSINRMMEVCEVKLHIADEFVLSDFASFPLPDDNRHMECVFVGLCYGGEGCFSIGTIEHHVQANDVLFVGEGQVLGDIKISEDFCGDCMLISHKFLYDVIRTVSDVSNLFVFTRENPVFSLTSDEVMMFKEYLRILKLRVADKKHIFRRQLCGTLVAAMIYDLCNASSRSSMREHHRQTRSQRIFKEFITLVEENFRTQRHVGWYSDALQLSPKTLLEMVKRVSQRTPNDWLDIYTTLEIRLLLRNTSKSIKEIAEELNFGTQSSMGKFFKDHVGVSPSVYRQG